MGDWIDEMAKQLATEPAFNRKIDFDCGHGSTYTFFFSGKTVPAECDDCLRKRIVEELDRWGIP